MNIDETLGKYGYTLCNDNIIRDKHNHPKCCNEIYQYLVCKIQDGETLTPQEDHVYGSCILSLAEIILNNKMMRFQTDDIKDECRGAMYLAILECVPKYWDRSRGSAAYSYAFRVGYTTCVHILKDKNKRLEIQARLIETAKDMYGSSIPELFGNESDRDELHSDV